MSDRELFDKYIAICNARIARLMDVQEAALFMALRDMLKKGAEAADALEAKDREIKRLYRDTAAAIDEVAALRERLRELEAHPDVPRWMQDAINDALKEKP